MWRGGSLHGQPVHHAQGRELYPWVLSYVSWHSCAEVKGSYEVWCVTAPQVSATSRPGTAAACGRPCLAASR